jgi:CDP-glucose 4,6-dehydratase
MFDNFFCNKKVFITGHTGFKGSWLCIWLHSLGAQVSGYALAPPTNPSLYELARVDRLVATTIGDVRDNVALQEAMRAAKPEIVIHMAAQSLVRESYRSPVDTYAINVMGTVNLLEAVRQTDTVRAVINVTTDKCYENKEWPWGYRENEPLGGYDPYSSSKGCSELVTSAYRRSFFNSQEYAKHGVALASVRAGNVIGGGDWAVDRLFPDCIRALLANEEIIIRSPNAVRPWQHVLEPLCGYLMLAERLYNEGSKFAEAWNFGPLDEDARPVEWIVKKLCSLWGEVAGYKVDEGKHLHEANYLKLDISKARTLLGWQPRWKIERAMENIVSWVRCFQRSGNAGDISRMQIDKYQR